MGVDSSIFTVNMSVAFDQSQVRPSRYGTDPYARVLIPATEEFIKMGQRNGLSGDNLHAWVNARISETRAEVEKMLQERVKLTKRETSR